MNSVDIKIQPTINIVIYFFRNLRQIPFPSHKARINSLKSMLLSQSFLKVCQTSDWTSFLFYQPLSYPFMSLQLLKSLVKRIILLLDYLLGDSLQALKLKCVTTSFLFLFLLDPELLNNIFLDISMRFNQKLDPFIQLINDHLIFLNSQLQIDHFSHL